MTTTHFEKQGSFFKVDNTDDGNGIAYGWCLVCEEDGVPHVDSQGDHIPVAAMLDAAASFAESSRIGKDQHAGDAIATVPYIYPITTSTNTLGIESNRTGLVIGWKPNDPEVLKSIADGSRTGFSIGGVLEDSEIVDKAATDRPAGARIFRRFRISEISLVDRPAVPGALVSYVKSATPTEDEALAKHRADLEAQLAKQLADAAYEQKVVTESHAFLDETCARHGIEYATKVAETNRDSIGRWGATWLEKRAATTSADADPAAYLKQTREALVAADNAVLDYVAKFAKATKQTAAAAHVALVRSGDAAFQDLYAKASAARRALTEPRETAIEKAATSTIETLQAQIDKAVEDFSIAQNLTPADAHARLLQISPSFLAMRNQLSQAYTDRAIAHDTAEGQLMLAHHAADSTANDAKLEALRAAEETPMYRALRLRVEQYQRDENIPSYAQAAVKAMRTDAETQRLYAAASAAQSARG